ncbi:MAG: tetratricopeptide repeat protein [Moraxellaceae bacterium]|nr:tetratricopeptide repeat protein [Moraxellaceae bacterium]MDZ4387597.1 tetratricopeptide repeat protein [Moraxellaceae bacterium]
MRYLWCLLVPVLAGCTALNTTPTRTINTVQVESVNLDGQVIKTELPARIECRRELAQEDELKRSMAQELAEQGSYYAALAQTESLPQHMAKVALLKADILRRLDPNQAELWYRALLGGCQNGFAEHGLGLLEAGRGRYSDAVARLAEAARLHPADARIRNDYGVALMHLARDDSARFEMRTAHELAPEDQQPQFNLMLLSLLTSDAAAWQQMRSRWQPSATLRVELRTVCQQLSQIRQASGAASRACLIDPML